MESKIIKKSEVNKLLRNAQLALWELENIVFTRSEILGLTGKLQGKKYPADQSGDDVEYTIPEGGY